ncbi:AMP-binding protein [candidate division KSB1 bacterium]|nr:AMP-binding protein [candidate division KSB1 bacterium]
MNFLTPKSLLRRVFEWIWRRKTDENASRLDHPWLRHYDRGVAMEPPPPDASLISLYLEALQSAGQSPALVYFDRRFTYAEIGRFVRQFASGLQSLGVGVGTHVALILPNCPQFVITYWAGLVLGGRIVPINPLLSEREMRNQLKMSGAQVAIVLDRLFPRLYRIYRHTGIHSIVVASLETFMPTLDKIGYRLTTRIARTRQHTDKDKAVHLFRDLLQYPERFEIPEIDPESPAVLLFTGGVTGVSKLAALSHRNLLANALQARAWIPGFRDGKNTILAALPLLHSYGLTVCHHLAWQSKALVLLEPRFNPNRVARLSRKYHIDLFPGVPTMFSALVKLSNTSFAADVCISGGSALPETLRRDFRERFGISLIQGYGLTEAGPITHCNPVRGHHRAGSIGLPWPGTVARIVDLETGAALPPGRVGELQVAGPQIMTGYYRNLKETKEVCGDTPWLRTGDVAVMDSDGYFFIVDRKKDIIFSGGYNIYPSEVESVLRGHPAIAEAVVVGMPDSYYGEKVFAYLLLHKGRSVSIAELRRFCRDKLTGYKIPREILIVDQIPRNFLGKPLRSQLLQAAKPIVGKETDRT